MNLSDLDRAPAAGVAGEGQASADRSGAEIARWLNVVQTLGAEMSGPLTSALERVQTLASTGRIGRASLRALAEEIQQVRLVGMIGQQLSRLASGRLRQDHERLRLTDTLRDVVNRRIHEAQTRGLVIKQVLKPAEVIVDAGLLSSLFDALVAWMFAHAQSTIELRTDIKPWPAHARVTCRFTPRALDEHIGQSTEVGAAATLDTIVWRLVEQTACAMGLPLERRFDGTHITVTLEFPRTVNDQLEGLSAIELEHGFSPSMSSKPLAGSQVLVVASRRDVRVQVRDAVRNMGLMVDFVTSVEEAREFCRGGLPHAIVFEAVLRGDRFNDLCHECEANGAEVAFIEIVEEGSAFEISGVGGPGMARVGRDAIIGSLPSALMFELSKAT